MFDDFREANLEFEFSDAMSDREVLYAIYCAGEIGDFNAADGWRLLAERHPDDPRFLLLSVFELLGQTGGEHILVPLERLAARITEELRPWFRDLLSAADDLDDEQVYAEHGFRARWDRLTAKLPDEDIQLVYERLNRRAYEVLKECHDRTLGGRSIGGGSSGV